MPSFPFAAAGVKAAFEPYTNHETVEFVHERWGHAISAWRTDDGGQTARIMGHSAKRFSKGSCLILGDGKGGTTRYRVVAVNWYRDPSDMFEAKVEFAPRSAAAKGAESNE